MAYTRIHAIKRTLNKALEYIENPEKTDEQLLVSGYNVDPLVGSIEMTVTREQARQALGRNAGNGKEDILAYHMIQSFSPTDNVTPEQAHELGKELADQFLGGQYEYVISTHIDKGHIHNHIIFNATSFYTFRKFRTSPITTAMEIRNISDRICADAGLSVIKMRKQLGETYEYTPQKRSYRSLIRQRIRIALQVATNWDEYTAALWNMGVTVSQRGSNTTYRMEGQERATRDRALDKDGGYLRETIEERLSANAVNLEALRRSIRAAVRGATDYKDFVQKLAEDGIKTKRERNGGVRYIDNTDTGIREWSLGAAYSTQSLKAAIQTQDYSVFDSELEDPANLAKTEFERTDIEIQTIFVSLPREYVEKTTADGILFRVPSLVNGTFFLDKTQVKYNQVADTFQIALSSAYNYTAKTADGMEQKKGEDLIRALELDADVKPTVIELYGENIAVVSNKGVGISLPEFGIQNLFVPAEFVEYDQSFGGSCQVALWNSWSYEFTASDKRKRFVIGSELIEQLQKRQGKIDRSLAGKIRAMQRRNQVAETKQLASTLNLLRRENIGTMADFDKKVDALRRRMGELKAQIEAIKQKSGQYRQAAKYLQIYNEYKPYQMDLALRRTPASRAEYRALHEGELNALEHAVRQLQKMGVNLDVDAEKVMELCRQQDQEAAELAARAQELQERAVRLQTAKTAVEALQMPNERQKEQERDTEGR